ncbi:ABC transporter ATP-binding protein [Saccharibacillus sp. O23]|uniref:ABC transporter ATP-binding protein n=1 Tax=Saccharibacillus sp. O23 TaxID=2009338 RepID=UPI000B4E3DB2|nr:ABC transporter ATP-binding protein [Saccharibacillus sp. O23]OWR30005.1 ABC transporter ATP-binding protein [Saccharibacillus sp. O23]
MNDTLILSKVSKSFGGRTVVEGVSFSVSPQTLFGFIGQNGAGKTTTMKMILGLLPADHGEIRVNGEKVSFGQTPTNRHIGYLPDVPEFYGSMTAREYLALCGRITGMNAAQIERKSAELLHLVGLEKAASRIRGFSRGMKQRLGIAQALLNDPSLLICDEPTSALDPLGRKEILELLTLAKQRTAILFSSHILSDVERVCDELVLLHQGKIVRSGTLEQVKSAGRDRIDTLEVEFRSAEELARFRTHFPRSRIETPFTARIEESDEDGILDIMRILAEHQLPAKRIEKLEPSLEELFAETVHG